MAVKESEVNPSPHRWLERCPDMGTGPIPIERMTDPAWFEKERQKVFKRAWLHVGREEEIPEPGDFLTQEIVIAGTSVLVVRGEDGVVRAFHNACRHRASKLVFEERGSGGGVFGCRFHGWSYDSEGKLIHVPQEDRYYESICGKKNLVPLHCDTWNGFIFICLDPEPRETLREFLGEAYDFFDGYPFAEMASELHYRGEIAANWKIVMDSQAEGVHAPFTHTSPWPNLFSTPTDPYTRYLDISFYGKHRSYTLAAGEAYQPTEVEALALSLGPAISSSGAGARATCKRLNPTNDPYWSFDCLVLYPNLLVYCFGGVYHTHQFWPKDIRNTTWDLRMNLPKPATPSEAFSREHAKIFLRDPFLEDGVLNEESQKVIESGALDGLHLQDDEALIRHCHWVLEQEVLRED